MQLPEFHILATLLLSLLGFAAVVFSYYSVYHRDTPNRLFGVVILLRRGHNVVDRTFDTLPWIGKIRVATRLAYIRYIHETATLFFQNGPFAFILGMSASTLTALTLFNNELVIITAIYASLLFFKEIFLEPFPLPGYEYTLKHATDNSPGRAFKVKVENRGDATLYRPRIKYRILSRDGQTLVGWRPETYHFQKRPKDELEPGEESEYFEVNLSETDCFDVDSSPSDEWERAHVPNGTYQQKQGVIIEFKISSRLKKGYVKARDMVFLWE